MQSLLKFGMQDHAGRIVTVESPSSVIIQVESRKFLEGLECEDSTQATGNRSQDSPLFLNILAVHVTSYIRYSPLNNKYPTCK
jgi:hypothetical protein